MVHTQQLQLHELGILPLLHLMRVRKYDTWLTDVKWGEITIVTS